MSIELVPLCTATISINAPIRVSSSMLVGEVAEIQIEGERLRGAMIGRAAADWLRVSPDGYGIVDVRFTMETHDGAVVFVSYAGRFNFAAGTVFTTPTFHTGDERYVWLNAIQAVAKGGFSSPTTVVYEMFELR
jgi:hypothetical protein